MGKSSALGRGVLLAILFCGLQSGCATVVKGTTQKVPISSDPQGADVTVDGQAIGQTPIDVTLARKRDHLVTVAKEGYRPKSVAVTKSVGGAVWGNILAGGLIGWGIDATSGAQYNLSPESITVRLDPLGESETSEADGQSKSDFIRRLNELDELKEQKKISDEEYEAIRTALFKEYYPEMDAELTGASAETALASPDNPKADEQGAADALKDGPALEGAE